jgi:hypothetical protein
MCSAYKTGPEVMMMMMATTMMMITKDKVFLFEFQDGACSEIFE